MRASCIDIAVFRPDGCGKEQVKSYLVAPGLAVHRQIAWNYQRESFLPTKRWAITHILSGLYIIIGLASKAKASHLALQLSELVDWTKDRGKLLSQPDETQGMIKVIKALEAMR